MRKLQNLGRPLGAGQLAFNGWVTRAIDEIQKASAEISKGIDVDAAVAAGFLTETAADLLYQPIDVETAFSPVFTASSGALTSVTSDIVYVKTGNRVFMTGEFTITDAGTGAAAILMTLPLPAARPAVGSALEVAATGFDSRVRVDPGVLGASLTSILKYDNTTLIATGRRILFSLTYLTA